jgi:UV DNA damage endonuclease
MTTRQSAAPRASRPRAGNAPAAGPRLGLCCQFAAAPIKFRTTTAAALVRLPRAAQLARLAELARANADALLAALDFCRAHRIGSFRIISSLLPLRTHPTVGYHVADLPDADALVARLLLCGDFAREHGIRTGFHPDQFVVLSSPNPDVVERSLADLEAQAELAEWTHADTINIHAGGAYGDKPAALARFRRNLERLTLRARSRLTIENDDTSYTPAELLALCHAERVPLVYDVHHHRCLPDGLSVAEATAAALLTWDREPLFHLSSPRAGWDGPYRERHHDYVVPADFPAEWRSLAVTVEIEAKAKELAVARLQAALDADRPVPPARRRSRSTPGQPQPA